MTDLMTRNETMKKLNWSSVTIWRRCRDGIIHPVWIGRRMFFAEAEVQKLAEDRRERQKRRP